MLRLPWQPSALLARGRGPIGNHLSRTSSQSTVTASEMPPLAICSFGRQRGIAHKTLALQSGRLGCKALLWLSVDFPICELGIIIVPTCSRARADTHTSMLTLSCSRSLISNLCYLLPKTFLYPHGPSGFLLHSPRMSPRWPPPSCNCPTFVLPTDWGV